MKAYGTGIFAEPTKTDQGGHPIFQILPPIEGRQTENFNCVCVKDGDR